MKEFNRPKRVRLVLALTALALSPLALRAQD